MFREELEIRFKLLNLILLAAFFGGCVSFLVSTFIGVHISSSVTMALVIFVVGFTLWMANKKNKPQKAAVILVVAANMIIFPIMYFTSGGMNSGMPIWLVLGLIFSWLLLTEKACLVMYVLNVVVVFICVLIEIYYPQMVVPLEGKTAPYWDMLQSMIVVTCILGLIFKYQTYVYEKKKEQLLKANQAKNEFLANMSHEVRTPINAILGYNEMVIKESQESHTTSYALNIQAAGKTLLSLVNDIFDFTTIEKEELKLKSDPYQVREILQDVLIYADYTAEKKGLSMVLKIDENIPKVLLGDELRLKQVLDNLISNAVKYTKEGSVEIIVDWKKTDVKEGTLFVKIKDTGIGMKMEDVEKISESFIRFDKEQTRNIQGIGLGLTIVTRILEHMGSRLIVESEFGKGSIFSFDLKQQIVDDTPIGSFERESSFSINGANQEELLHTHDVRILVIDDNLMNLDLFCGMLKRSDIQIDTGVNGKEALELLRQNKYHMVFMDHMMPVMDGLETLKRIKAEKLCEDIPVIVLTANAVGNVKEEYLEAGFDDYLSKPIMSKELFAMIRKYLPCELIEQEGKVAVDSPFPFLDTKTGMEYCCNNEDFYREMLKSYLDNDKTEVILKSYKEEDWEQYRILVHALKSTSLSIGAVEVSEDAKKLEMAAKENRICDIKCDHASVMKKYQTLLKQLKVALEEKNVHEDTNIVEITQDKERILVVDDDVMNLHIAEKILEAEYNVDCVKSGIEALDYFKEKIPNLVLLDLHMPQMDGFEVNLRMKQSEQLKEIPVVFLTADHDRETEIRGFREGALEFITKPFIADIMLQRVKRILELDRLQKNLQEEVEKQTRTAEARRKKVERLSMQIMTTLADTIDAKDKYTNGHSVRVAEYAKEIAKRAGKTPQEQEDVYYVGLLHDIGKIGIPNAIINKTTKLTDEEYELIKSHTTIGAEILSNMNEIPGLPIGAHWHHELYNGKGYPDGLKGEKIPEMARIIGVADAYDAMASKRSYRDVLPQQVIREELVKGRGSQFDPQFADIMIQMIDEDKEYRLHE